MISKLFCFLLLFIIIFPDYSFSIDYFGQQTGSGSYEGGNANYTFGSGKLANDTIAFTCPGSGNKKIISLGAYIKSNGSGAGSFRMAIYSINLDTLYGQHSNGIKVPASWSSGDWRGEQMYIDQYLPLVGGTLYSFVITFNNSDPQILYYNGESGDMKYASDATSYNHFPASLSLSSNYNHLFNMRCGIEPYADLDTTLLSSQVFVPFETGSNGDTIKTVSTMELCEFGGAEGLWSLSNTPLSNGSIDTVGEKALNGLVNYFGNTCADTGSRGLRYNIASKQSVVFSFLNRYDSVSCGFFWKTNIPYNNYNGHSFFDFTFDSLEYSAFAFLNSNTTYHSSVLETTGGDSVGPPLYNATWYWITIKYSKEQNKSFMNIYSDAFALLDTTVIGITTKSSKVKGFQFGLVGGSDAFSDYNVYFDDIVLDVKKAKFPLLPTGWGNLYLDSVAPDSGYYLDTIKIYGRGFASTQGSSTIAMGDSTSTVTSWSNTLIKFLCPDMDTGFYDFIVAGPDNSDTILNAFYVLDVYIDSISPVKGKRSSLLFYYCTDLMDSSANVRAKINSLNMPIKKWRNSGINDTVEATIPVGSPRGFYWPHLDILFGGDTIPLDTSPSRYRVLVPEIINDGTP